MSSAIETRLFGEDVSLALSWPWAAYWLAFLRVLVGTVFLHAGMDKFLADQPFDAGWWLTGSASEGLLAPVMVWFGQNAPWFVNLMIPLGELLIGIGLIVGGLTRLASFFGAILMFFLYFGNADWEHGFVNGDLILLGTTVMGIAESFFTGHTLESNGNLGDVVIHTTHSQTLRATLIALGFVVFFVYAVYRVASRR